jgi:inosose dehydratase
MRVANAPVSWGVLEFDLEGEAATCVQVLDEIRDTGYAGTELGDWGFLPTDPSELSDELNLRGLELLAAFIPVKLADAAAHEQGEQEAIRAAELLAAVAGEKPFIVLSDDNGSDHVRTQNAGRIKPEHAMHAEQWEIFTNGAIRIAKAVSRKVGIRTVFHHHCAGYIETPDEVSELMARTDSELLGLCLDTGHYRFAGGDPAGAVSEYGKRIWHVHFKDCEPEIAARSRSEGWDYFHSVGKGVFCELGQGEVDFPSVLSALGDIGFDGWGVVEQDVLPGMGTPKQSAQRNRAYLEGLGI